MGYPLAFKNTCFSPIFCLTSCSAPCLSWSPTASVTLDPETAHPNLILSQDCKGVRHEDKSQELINNFQRFSRNVCVLGRERFKAGRHYWEVTVESEGDWAVGVAKWSVQRKDHVALSTKEGIWAVGKRGGCYWSSYVSNQPIKFQCEKVRRIYVYLNYEEGQVAFYDADTKSYLYQFYEASFSTEILLPFFYVNRNVSLTISP